VTIAIKPKSVMRSLKQGGSAHVRIIAPLGFEFDIGCLAVTPDPTFTVCEGSGRVAVLAARDATIPAGPSSSKLWVTNAGLTPADNRWILESFLDLSMELVASASAGSRQMSHVEGYSIRELLQATIGANAQRGAVTTVFVWFLATRFLDIGASVELHAPRDYELRCTPRVQYINMPAGSCQLKKGTLASSGGFPHAYLVLTLTMPDQLIYPNVPYEFGVAAVNPELPVEPNHWGVALLNPRKEVVDATMTLDGYALTDYRMIVYSLLASSTLPTVVNAVRLVVSFQKELSAGVVGHVTIRAPVTTKVICQRFADISGGGNTKAMLPLDPTFGTYGTHSCQLQNTLTLHFRQTEPVQAGSYVLSIVVLNPGIRASRDYWAVELLRGAGALAPQDRLNSTATLDTASNAAPAGWITAQPSLRIQVEGFGVSTAFRGPTIDPVANLAHCMLDCGSFFFMAILLCCLR